MPEPTVPGPAAPGDAAPTRRRPGSRAVAVLAVLVGAGLTVLAAGRPWFTTTVVGLPGPDLVTTDGRSVAPAAPALGLVAAAGAVVLATGGRIVRAVVAALLLLAGAGVVAVGVGLLGDPVAALEPAIAKATGTTGSGTGFVGHVTPWPVVSIAGGLGVALGGLVGVVRGRRWAQPSRRFERVPSGVASGVPSGVASGAPAVGNAAAGGDLAGGAGAPDPAVSAKDARLDAWDRLSQGDDPTV